MTTATTFFPISSILVASSNEFLRKQIVEKLQTRCLPVREAKGGADALLQLEGSACRLLLLDNRLSDLNTDELIETVESRYPTTEVVMLEAETGRPLLPPESSKIAAQVSSALETLPAPRSLTNRITSFAPMTGVEPLPNMVGESEALCRTYRMTRLVAQRDTTVIVTGETGTGKELVAEALHQLSRRADRPFVTVNCAAIPDTLLEAELFGYTRGAFTGAVQPRVGRIHSAQGGTLFLDEIGEMPLGVQAKLLRFLENGEVQRLGSSDTFRVDVRVVAATNAALAQRVAEGRFREDLFYRLSVFPIDIPPLRERDDDVLLLADYFLRKFCPQMAAFTEESAVMLRRHHWPGNVRELRHVVERAVIMADGDPSLTPEHILLGGCDRSTARVN